MTEIVLKSTPWHRSGPDSTREAADLKRAADPEPETLTPTVPGRAG
jgi:hypothetical protein